tara:strand:- start:212 stop:334 length:123 start_codon:yes stop_codon:yes gene_type:complete
MRNIPVSNVEWEMLQAIAKKQRKNPKQVISEFLNTTYMRL